MTAELRTERRDTTLVLTISDPGSRNALTPQVLAAGIEALSVAEADPSVHTVVLVGDGAHFCAGSDLQRLAADRKDPGAAMQQGQMFNQFIEALRTHPKPVIAAVEGTAAAGGFSLALACDLIVAAEDARFAMAQGHVGLSPDGGGSWHLARALPRALALQLIWQGEPVTARELQARGLVNRVTDSGQAFVEALRWAHQLSACAPNVLASAKELVNQARLRPLNEHLNSESTHFADTLSHANGAEGLQAFLEKREPRFR
ncbi:oxepin-CoA hydrolase, alternative type [Methylibium sp.]|uniref:oxepin-CoA hydrolase, alternative type n=1 Tax=Methylibium sp. TaxID=2067992 RepID=UPI003D14595D